MNAEPVEIQEDFVFGKSLQMQEVHAQMQTAVGGTGNTLITGPSGTGKDLAGRYIHRHSDRATGPFVPVNCGAIPKELFESELFGHLKGAYTGAVSDTKGLFRAAEGGTIFLDEVTEIPPEVQVKLLRVLQDKRIRPLGATEEIPVDVRVLAATNRDINRELERGALREDFFFRLSGLTVHMPTLRERLEDIPDLVSHFIDLLNHKFDKNVAGIETSVLDQLMSHVWLGNVRELEQVIENAFLSAEADEINSIHLETHERPVRFSPASERQRIAFDQIEWFQPVMTDKLTRQIQTIAQTPSGVLIFGEEGTGGQLVAREIHRQSRDEDDPYVMIYCDAITQENFERELFGDSGRTGDKEPFLGYANQARGGTLYLREITSVPLPFQQRLYSLLDSQLFALSENSNLPPASDTRVIGYTSEDLDEALETGRFSLILYARLSAFSIYLPPLREQKERYPEFVAHFLKMLGFVYKQQVFGVDDEVMELLLAYRWPGNFLEMMFVLQGALFSANFSTIRKDHLPDHILFAKQVEQQASDLEKLEDVELSLLQETLEKAGGNKAQAAQMLGISRNRLYRMLRKNSV